jgi:hypothetical protein
MNYSKRRDTNEPGIVTALQRAGAVVSRMGDFGAPDLLVGYLGRTYLLEVKMPLGPQGGVHHNGNGGRGDLTKAQVKWWDTWGGEPAHIVRSPSEALAAIGAGV